MGGSDGGRFFGVAEDGPGDIVGVIESELGVWEQHLDLEQKPDEFGGMP